MSFRNIRLLFRREMIDQFRDRRTLVMIFVVPLLLYPLLGALFFQLSHFVRVKPSRVLVVLCEEDAEDFENDFPTEKLLDFTLHTLEPDPDIGEFAEKEIREKNYDLILQVPPAFFGSLREYETRGGIPFREPGEDPGENARKLRMYYSSAYESSTLALGRIRGAIQKRNQTLGEEFLNERGIDIGILEQISSQSNDIVRESQYQGASFWSKMLPIMLLLWALTGAFYPAVDLCAGEKERGTLETLLCSPATRGEIVLGKMLTVACFSMLTSLLNVVCIAITGLFMVSKIAPQQIALPWNGAFWMLVSLFPAAMIFSALSLALASYAKSSKEGQYYLLPLIMGVMPLVLISIAPGSELTLGTALIPIAGIALSLRQLLEGDTALVLRFSPIVITITLLCCVFSIRFAIRQFNRESVLFSSSRKFDPVRDFRESLRKKRDRATLGSAILLGILILVLKYFAQLAFSQQDVFTGFVIPTILLQICIVLFPAVFFAFLLTRDPWKTLGLKAGNRGPGKERTAINIALAVVLALLLLPTNITISVLVESLYPVDESLLPKYRELQETMFQLPVLALVGLIALLPAFCEEIAFRGFILRGLMPPEQGEAKTVGKEILRNFDAILLSSFFFGITHGILQQSICATVVGCVLGIIAVQSRSIWPCIAYHFTHNATMVLITRFAYDYSQMEIEEIPKPLYFLVAFAFVIAMSLLFRMKSPEEGEVRKNVETSLGVDSH